MDRRVFIGSVAGGLLCGPLVARAQPTKVPRLGFLRSDRPPQSYIDAFEQGLRDRGAEALVVVQSTMFNTPPYRIAQLAARYKLPAVYGSRVTADDGGLMSYGPSNRDSYRYAAVFVDKILKGAKPGDLPVERPAKLELVINLRTASELGLTIPQTLLLRTDDVIH